MTEAVEAVVKHWPGWKINKGSATKNLKDGRFIMLRERGNHMVLMLGNSKPERWNKFDKTRRGAFSALDHANFMAGLYGGWQEE